MIACVGAPGVNTSATPSSLSSGMSCAGIVPKVIELLKAQDAGDVVVTVGGTIPAQDIPELKELGVAEVFTPGAPVQGIVDYIRSAVPA